jgi:hypothetical protein
MKTNFEIYKILRTGLPVPVQKVEWLNEALIIALRSMIHEPGHYMVCSQQNISEPIFELNDFETEIVMQTAQTEGLPDSPALGKPS